MASASRQPRVVLVEGLPGSGKSSTAQFIAHQLVRNGIAAQWFYEQEQPHPIPYQDSPDTAALRERNLGAWQMFVTNAQQDGGITILESQPFQSAVLALLRNDAGMEAIEAHLDAWQQVVQDLNPAFIYFQQRDVAQAMQQICSVRGQEWQQYFIRYATQHPQGQFPLVLGGDCSILRGSALALRRRGRYGLFFFDGHADFYSSETEVTGECASMDLALALGQGPEILADLDGLRPLLRESDTVVFGCRDATVAASEGSPDIRQTAVHVFELADVRRLGSAAAARRGLEALKVSGVEGLWVHLDADVLNDTVMPAVDYRMPDGLWPEELTEALGIVLASPAVIGMEVTIYNPTFDDE